MIGNLPRVKDALSLGANVNATDKVSLVNLLYKRILIKQLVCIIFFEYENTIVLVTIKSLLYHKSLRTSETFLNYYC